MSEMFAGGVLGFFVGWFVTVWIINITSGDQDKYDRTFEVPQRGWVDLTEEDIQAILKEWVQTDMTVREMLLKAKAKLKEKNT